MKARAANPGGGAVTTASRCGARAVGGFLRVIIGIYRAVLSPLIVALLGPACRFEPSCSIYAGAAIAQHGVVRGGWQALRRLLRCRPGGGWGYDPVMARSPQRESGTLATLAAPARDAPKRGFFRIRAAHHLGRAPGRRTPNASKGVLDG